MTVPDQPRTGRLKKGEVFVFHNRRTSPETAKNGQQTKIWNIQHVPDSPRWRPKNMIQWICSQNRRVTEGITTNWDSRNFFRALSKWGEKVKRLQIRNARIADQPNASQKIPTKGNFSVQIRTRFYDTGRGRFYTQNQNAALRRDRELM